MRFGADLGKKNAALNSEKIPLADSKQVRVSSCNEIGSLVSSQLWALVLGGSSGGDSGWETRLPWEQVQC